MGELAKKAQKISPWLRIADNDEVVVMYKGWKEIEDTRNPGKTKIRYIVELDGDDKWFESAAARVMMSFDSIREGEMVKIRKEVVGEQTRYFVEPLESKKEEEEEPKPAKGKGKGKN